MNWNVDPTFVAIGSMQIRWYGLLFATAFLVSFLIMRWIYRREGKDVQDVDRLAVYLFVATVIGARLGHCLLYSPAYYLSSPLKIFDLTGGGLASHGAGLGIALGLYLYQRKEPQSYLWFLDRIVIPAALAGFFIRLGNLFNSEIIGIPASVPWAVIFARIDSVPRHPVQLYEALAYLLIFWFLFLFYKRHGTRRISPAYVPKYAAPDCLPEPAAPCDRLPIAPSRLHPLCPPRDRLRRQDGLTAGLFFVSVFTARFFIEFVKTKQEAYSSEFWMNTGQMLSVPFVIVGAVLVLAAFKKVRHS